ncbi:MAG: molybdate ABC transporter substrate-binding protein [Acidobacteriaceae bacterium]|nr:molybdate ABC transporter substrate-binding protein [Acidobacteriaceae bacterium]
MSLRLSSCLVVCFVLAFAHVAHAVSQTTLAVAAASDLTPLEIPLGSSFGKTHPGIHISWVTASSAMLSQQIRNGAPYDVFLSANAQFVDELASNRNLLTESVTSYAVGRLGVLWRDGKRHPLSNLAAPDVRFVALPNPKLAPYGVAAQQALEHAGIWSRVRSKVVYGENVRQALELFESGNADAVLTSDSLLRGRNAELIPADWHSPILQKAGIVAKTTNLDAARRFIRFLSSPAAQDIFAQFGFSRP